MNKRYRVTPGGKIICEHEGKVTRVDVAGSLETIADALNIIDDLDTLDKTKWDWGIDSIAKITPPRSPSQYDVYLQDATGEGANIENEPDLFAVIRAAAGWARQHGKGEGTPEQRRWRE